VTNIHKVLSRGIYLGGRIEDRFPFTEHISFSSLNQPRNSFDFGELKPAKEFTIEKEFTTKGMSQDNTG
jgi:hypothetical protein